MFIVRQNFQFQFIVFIVRQNIYLDSKSVLQTSLCDSTTKYLFDALAQDLILPEVKNEMLLLLSLNFAPWTPMSGFGIYGKREASILTRVTAKVSVLSNSLQMANGLFLVDLIML